MFWPDPTHQPTHPPNYTPTHGWGSLHRFQIFKQNWKISISLSTIEFWLILRVPLGVGSGERVPPHMCMCTCISHHREFPGIPQKSNGSSHLHEIIMFTTHECVCACVHACTCAHVWGAPPTTPTQPTPHPQSHREAKTPKFNKSWTNRDNSILFEDSLPLNIPELIMTIADHPGHPPPTYPTPQSQGNTNRKNYNNSWTNMSSNMSSTNHQWTLNPYHQPFMV